VGKKQRPNTWTKKLGDASQRNGREEKKKKMSQREEIDQKADREGKKSRRKKCFFDQVKKPSRRGQKPNTVREQGTDAEEGRIRGYASKVPLSRGAVPTLNEADVSHFAWKGGGEKKPPKIAGTGNNEIQEWQQINAVWLVGHGMYMLEKRSLKRGRKKNRKKLGVLKTGDLADCS